MKVVDTLAIRKKKNLQPQTNLRFPRPFPASLLTKSISPTSSNPITPLRRPTGLQSGYKGDKKGEKYVPFLVRHARPREEGGAAAIWRRRRRRAFGARGSREMVPETGAFFRLFGHKNGSIWCLALVCGTFFGYILQSEAHIPGERVIHCLAAIIIITLAWKMLRPWFCNLVIWCLFFVCGVFITRKRQVCIQGEAKAKGSYAAFLLFILGFYRPLFPRDLILSSWILQFGYSVPGICLLITSFVIQRRMYTFKAKGVLSCLSDIVN